MAIDSTQATPSGLDVWPPIVASGGGGSVDTMAATASENLLAGALCNIWNNGGVFNVRNADASKGAGYEAHGWTDAAVTSGNAATVRFLGVNTHSSGLTPGPVFLGNTGAATSTAPTTAGYLSQEVGSAESASSFSFEWHPDILLATPTAQVYGGSSQAIEITSSGNLNIPAGVSGGTLTMVGGGGGGSSLTGGAGGGGGGAGEVVVSMPIAVTPSTAYAVTIGAGGPGAPAGAGSAAGTNGGDTSIVIGSHTFYARGGVGAASSGHGGAGGGTNGGSGGVAGSGAGPGVSGAFGAIESPVHFGGCGGGGGGSASPSNGGSGAAAGGFNSGAAGGTGASAQGGGGGGAATMWGLGGAGGNGGVAGISASAGAYGAAGGGAGGLTGSNGAAGNGASGYLLFEYVA